jgi:hypothetical protein
MDWLPRLFQVWLVVCAVLVVTGLAVSRGEPVCEGPLILDVDDSDPPQCDDPISSLPTAAPLILGIGLLVSGPVTAAWTLASRRRPA